MAALRLAEHDAKLTGDNGMPFLLLTFADDTTKLIRLAGFDGDDAVAAAYQELDSWDAELGVALYCLAQRGYVNTQTMAYAFRSTDAVPTPALLFRAGGYGAELGLLMGLVAEDESRFEPKPSFFLGVDNWCRER